MVQDFYIGSDNESGAEGALKEKSKVVAKKLTKNVKAKVRLWTSSSSKELVVSGPPGSRRGWGGKISRQGGLSDMSRFRRRCWVQGSGGRTAQHPILRGNHPSGEEACPAPGHGTGTKKAGDAPRVPGWAPP